MAIADTLNDLYYGMKSFFRPAAYAVAMAGSLYGCGSPERSGCETDLDCRKPRVCDYDNGRCVESFGGNSSNGNSPEEECRSGCPDSSSCIFYDDFSGNALSSNWRVLDSSSGSRVEVAGGIATITTNGYVDLIDESYESSCDDNAVFEVRYRHDPGIDLLFMRINSLVELRSFSERTRKESHEDSPYAAVMACVEQEKGGVVIINYDGYEQWRTVRTWSEESSQNYFRANVCSDGRSVSSRGVSCSFQIGTLRIWCQKRDPNFPGPASCSLDYILVECPR